MIPHTNLSRSVYARWDAASEPKVQLEQLVTILADDAAPGFIVHLAKIDDAVEVITPLGWLDKAEAGCMEAVHWHPGLVVRFAVVWNDELDMIHAIERAGGQHLGS